MRWTIERHTAPAADHLALPPAEGPEVRILDVVRPAVIMGSSQAESTLDPGRATAAGVDVARRPSGGGAVLVVPGEALWMDVFVPAGDRLWVDDVGVAFHWLGRAWTQALAAVGVAARWHDGAMRHTAWSKVVCFAGLGPGEVLDAGGRKVVGLSQRRTRTHARFQCCVMLRWDPDAMVALLAEPYPEGAAVADLGPVAAGIGPGKGEPLLASFTEVLTAL
ncbi:MAG: lipoyl protein ligase domain-containing protein [Acidimicrobiia bacterium]